MQNNKKLVAAIAATIALILILCGCNALTPQDEATPTPTITEVPISYRQEQAVTEVQLGQIESMTDFLSLGNGLAIVCYNEYGGYESLTDDTCVLSILNIVTHDIVKSTSIPGSGTLYPRMFTDGSIALKSYSTTSFIVLDKNLEKVNEFAVNNVNGQFSHDGKFYYFILDEALAKLDTQTLEVTQVPLQYEMGLSDITDIHPTEDYLLANVYTDPSGYSPMPCTIDLATGNYLQLRYGAFMTQYFENAIYECHIDADTYEYSIMRGKDDVEVVSDSGMLGDGTGEYCFVSDSNLLMYTTTSKDGDIDEPTPVPQAVNLFRFGDKIECCNMSALGIKTIPSNATYLPQENLLLCYVYQDEACHVYIVDLELLEYTECGAWNEYEDVPKIDTEVVDKYVELSKPACSNEELADLYIEADRIAEKYDINILLSGDCKAPLENGDYVITTTDENEDIDEYEVISRMLSDLDITLKQYPEGFFSQFCTQFGAGGIRVFFVDKIESDNGIIGFANDSRLWYNVIIGTAYQYNAQSTIAHELWHSTESRILLTNGMIFDDEVWNTYNPEDFEYYYVYDPERVVQSEYTYFAFDDDDIYFVDDYAMTNPKEDRARIMEYVMMHDYDAKEFLKSDALYQKYIHMCDAVRAGFDTTGWEDVVWERFLKD